MNQIEVHPFNTHAPLTALCASHNITIQAYAPLARALRMKHPVIAELAKKYECTPAQLMVRWSLQKGYVPLPKSVRESRIKENADVSAGRLGQRGGIDKDDMGRLDGCDEGLVTGEYQHCPQLVAAAVVVPLMTEANREKLLTVENCCRLGSTGRTLKTTRTKSRRPELNSSSSVVSRRSYQDQMQPTQSPKRV